MDISDIPIEYYCSSVCYDVTTYQEDPSNCDVAYNESEEESEDPSNDEYDDNENYVPRCNECNGEVHECKCMNKDIQAWIDYILDEDYDY
jgi:hypothetical protein